MYQNKLIKLLSVIDRYDVDSYLEPLVKRHNAGMRGCDRRIEWFAGFTGDFGYLLISGASRESNREANCNICQIFFTNSIHQVQAERELSHFDLLLNYHENNPIKWIVDNAKTYGIKSIGYSGDVWTVSSLKKYEEVLAQAGIKMIMLSTNPIDEIWDDKPSTTLSAIGALPIKYTGQESNDKILKIGKTFDADYMLISAADSIAWLLNARGHDIPNAPLFFADLLVPKRCHDVSECTLIAKQTTIDLFPSPIIQQNISEVITNGMTIAYDPSITTAETKKLLDSAGAICCEIRDPCQTSKSIKNSVELAGFTSAHIRDASAVINFMYWLDNIALDMELDEWRCAEKIDALRAEQQLFQFTSFPSIVGFNENGTIIHYHPTQQSSAKIKGNGILLVDSGGHYLDGTTDITRTFAIGQPTRRQKELYTLVLKGHLALQRAVFPHSTTTKMLDVLARQFLWRKGMDYLHGTGHGVGHFLAVHEFPPSMGVDGTLQPGMIITIEPGVYPQGEFGVRIENVVEVVKHTTNFLAFKPLTMVPYDKRLFDMDLLTTDEIRYINGYHEKIICTVGNLLDSKVREWLETIV